MKKENRGGKREGAGRPKEFCEPTVYVGFNVPISIKEKFVNDNRRILDKHKKKK